MSRSIKVLGLISTLFTSAMLFGGCFSLGGYSTSGGPSGSGPAFAAGALTVSNGYQSGGMGDIRAFDGDATRHSGYYDTYGSNIRVDSEGSGWWVMSSINITGDLRGPEFAPGTHRVYTSGTYDPSSNVSVTGCSGPSYGSYTYDGPADETAIDIEDLGGGNRRLHFETIHDGAVTTGSVDYRIDGSSGSTAPRGI